ncbi:uncharacterized protein LOC142463257 isoform X2 [Ascaphus truei]|uniref:uncharacterized protein LOC142463257 isoform X2 n=1 Tax=Ascaphus truei TaxID=8439 RepID=UPI003F59F25C
MWRKGGTPGLLIIAVLLLSGYHVESQETCHSYAVTEADYCSPVIGIADLNTILSHGMTVDNPCSYSLQQYACAAVGGISSSKAVSILKCFLTKPEAIISQNGFSLLISKIPVDTLRVVLNTLDSQVTVSTITPNAKLFMLNAVWDSIRKDPDHLNPGFLATWFQERLYPFMPAIHADILDCMIYLPLTSDGFEAVVQALDVAYPNFDNTTRELIGNWISRFLKAHSYRKDSASEWILSYWKSFRNNVGYQDYVNAWSDLDVSSALDALTSFQVAQFSISSNAFSSSEKATQIMQILKSKDIFFIIDFLNSFSLLPITSFDHSVLFSLLETTLTKLKNSDSDICKPNLKDVFQDKIQFLLVAINEETLNLFPTNMDCLEYEDVFQGVNKVYQNLTEENQMAVYKYRLNFMNEEVKKAGAACTYGHDSTEWLELNFGDSISLLTYTDMIRLNPSFNGFEVTELLNINQTLDLLIQSNILVEETQVDYEIHISEVISSLEKRDFVHLEEFLIEFRRVLVEYNITVIKNKEISCLMLEGIWKILNTRFPQFSNDDWYKWFNENLPIFLPCIKKEQLSELPITNDCSSFQVIVKGLDIAFDYMDVPTKTEVTSWIAEYLTSTKCVSNNSLEVNWQRFVEYADISTLISVDPEFKPLEVLDQLTATQIGQVIMVSEEARNNVDTVEIIFDVLVNVSSDEVLSNLGSFWDSFNVAYEEVPTVELTEEVKFVMLHRTTIELTESYPTFDEKDYTLWFEERLKVVLPTIDSTILDTIPTTISCGSYEVMTRALNQNYAETAEPNKEDIFKYMTNYLTTTADTQCTDVTSTKTWVESYLGEFSTKATYKELLTYYPDFNVYEDGVLKLLTVEQIGDMIVESKTLESLESTTILFTFLETQTVAEVDACMVQFTETAIKEKKTVEDVSVGEYFLLSYLKIESTSLETFTDVQLVELFEERIPLLVKFFTTETLDIFPVQDCTNLTNIVAELDKAFDDMSATSREDTKDWIRSNLKQKTFNGCQSPEQTQAEWTDETWKSFFEIVTLEEIKEVYTHFDLLEVIDQASISQKVDYVVASNALFNVTTMNIVLESLKDSDSTVPFTTITDFLTEFNIAFEELPSPTMSPEVREEAMNFFGINMVPHFENLQEEEFAILTVCFRNLLPSITVDLVNLIPLDLTCKSYYYLYTGINNVYDELSEDVRQGVHDGIIAYLDQKSASPASSGMVCKTLYTDSETYLDNIFFNFTHYATFYELTHYYEEFDAYDVLPMLSGEQLGNMLMNTTAIRDQMKAVPILVELEKRDYDETVSFMTGCNAVAEERHIQTLPDANIEELIYKTVWDKVSVNVDTPEEYQLWFGSLLDLVITSVSVTDISTISMDIDCSAQDFMIQGFSDAYDKLSEDQHQAVHSRIKTYLKDVQTTQGSTCNSNLNSSEWISTNYGEFKELATLEEFQTLNPDFNAESALPEFTGTQIAEYVVISGALKSEESITVVLSNLDTTKEVFEFFQELNTVAQVELQTSKFIDLILESTFETISVDFVTFKEEEWTVCFQDIFQNVLFEVNEAQVQLIPNPLPCESYQQIIKGFNSAFEHMTKDTQEMIYNEYIQQQFNSTSTITGVKCGTPTERTQEWLDLNFGLFVEFADFTDLVQWNKEFAATEVITSLSVTQLADIILQVENLNNEEIVCQILGRVQHFEIDNIYLFLDHFSDSFSKLNINKLPSEEISSKMLSGFVTAIQAQLGSYSTSDWETLFSTRLRPFLLSLTVEQLNIFLSNANCDSFVIIVRHLNAVYDNLPAASRDGLYGSLLTFLKGHVASSGSACPVSGEGSKAWLARVLGKFSSSAVYDDLVSLNSAFNGLEVISDLSAGQVAGLAFTGEILDNAESAAIIVQFLEGITFNQLELFLTSFQSTANERNMVSLPNAHIRSSLWNAIFTKVSAQIKSFTTGQWLDYFQSKLSLFLPSITESQINLIPSNINCDVFHIIISALDVCVKDIQEDIQLAIYQKIKSYLMARKHDTGSACAANTAGSIGWLKTNLASFSVYATYEDIVALNSDFVFTEAVESLSVKQLAWYTVKSDALRSSDKIAKLMIGVNSNNIGGFLDEFNLAAQQTGLTQLPSADIRKFLVGEIFCRLGSLFSVFTSDTYTNWFQIKLKLFISSMNAKTLGFIPTDITCDSLAVLVNVFSDSTNNENPDDIFSFLHSVLQEQKTLSGNACNKAGLSDKEWLTTNFGSFSSYATLEELTTLNPTFRGANSADLLTSVQMASVSVSTSMIHNVSAINSLFDTIETKDDTQYLSSFLGVLRDFVLKDPTLFGNPRVRDAILMRSAKIIFPTLDTLPISEVQSWMSTFSFLLPGINATMLELLSEDLPCPYYQEVVQALDGTFVGLTAQKRIDVYEFLKKYLIYQTVMSGSACTAGTNEVQEWVQQNLGRFCRVSQLEEIQSFYPDINGVSYTRLCFVS